MSFDVPPCRDESRYASNRDGRFVDHMVSREHRFSLGVDTRTGSHFLSTPISGRMAAVEFEAWFSISAEDYARYRDDPASAEPFLELCRQGQTMDRRFPEIVTN